MKEMPGWSADLSSLRLGIYTRASDDSDETETSVDAQQGVGESWAESVGITQIERYCDNDKSASWYATKRRDDFDRLVEDIKAGKLDLVWFWKLNRSQRRLDVFADLRDLCRKHGVNWVIKRRVFDLTSPEDLRVLGNDAVNGEVFSLELSENVKLGLALRASKGKPGGGTTYGYLRQYSNKGKCVGQEPDETLREAISEEDGSSYWWSPAGVVREIITRIARGEVQMHICEDLTRRGIPTPRNGTKTGWAPGVIRRIALNRAYLGVLVHNGEVIERDEPCWTPVLKDEDGNPDEETFYAARAVLLGSGPRNKNRPTHSVHLLTNLIQCDICQSDLVGVTVKDYRWSPQGVRSLYRCFATGAHVGIQKEPLDEFVGRVIAGYLMRPDVYEDLMGAAAPDSEQTAIRTKLQRLRTDLEDWRRLAERGEVNPTSFARAERGIETQIKESEERLQKLAAPSVLAGRIGPNAKESWDDLGFQVKRQIIRLCADISIKRVGKGRSNVSVSERLVWRWKIGPDSLNTEPVVFPVTDTPDDALCARAEEVFAEMIADGKLPGVWPIRKTLHVGGRRAKVIQDHLQRAAPNTRRRLSRYE